MDAFLIIITIVLALLLLFCSFYLLVLYCHPEDRGWGTSLYCKILVIVGMTLSWAQVLILPLDVANSRGTGSGLDMETFWYIIYMSIGVLVVFLIPMAQFMYETDDEKPLTSRITTAICYEVVLLIVVGVALFVSYAYLHYAYIPLTVITQSTFESSSTVTTSTSTQTSTDTTLEIPVTFVIYVMSFTSFVGNWLFVLFAGVGLYALPIDMVMEFFNRPKLRKSSEAMEIKQRLKTSTEALIQHGKKVKRMGEDVSERGSYFSRRSELKAFEKELNTFRVSTLLLERDHDIFKLEINIAGTNPLVWVLKLILGIILFVVSLLWWLHIIIYVLVPGWSGFSQYPFLNKMLIGLEESGVSFLGTAIFAFLSLYLLWCVQKGNLKFGLRIPLLFTIHPMKINETWMNSFLFNVNLVLLCSVSVCQFCTKAFSQYTRLTTIDLMFNTQIRYMRFFNYFYKNNVFEYILIIWSALTCIYLLLKRSDKPKILREIEELRNLKIK